MARLTLTLSIIKINKGPTAPKIVPKCMVLNARFLEKPDAAPALYAELRNNNIDICYVSESWLSRIILSHLICPEGYVMVRKVTGGDICRKDWKVEVSNVTNSLEFESVWCKITTTNSEYHFGSVYHPPDPV